jgi:glycosyltransferase involved in cell wall biosynthesis
MNSNQLISIIIPVYNHEKFIRSTIESVISQTYNNWELLVVDDCSTDSSWKIIQEYEKKDSRIKAFKNEENKGLTYNWKFLIDNAKGEFLAFLEGDDFFYKENIKEKMEVFDKYPDLGMVYCNFSVIDEKGNIIINNYNNFQNIRVYKNELIKPSEYLSSKYHLINSYGQIMVRKNVCNKVGYPRTLDDTEKVFLPSDWDFNFRISTQNKIFFINKILFAYRKHLNNCSHDALKAYKHISLLLDEYEIKFADNEEVKKAIHYKRGRYVYSKVMFYLEQGKKKYAWKEFLFYMKNFKNNFFDDFDLNIKLIIRLFLPNNLNSYIRKRYYHQNN